ESGAPPAAENARKNVAEAGPTPAAGLSSIRKIKAAKVERNALRPTAAKAAGGRTAEAACAKSAAAGVGFGRRRINVVGVKAQLVVNLALLGIAQDVVGFGDLLEFLFGFLVAGIDVRMVLARQLAEGLAELIRRGALFYAQDGVIVF